MPTNPTLTVPRFNGLAMFGTAVHMVTEWNPRAEQRVTVAGLDGTATTDQGFRGMVTTASGVLFSPSPAGFGALLDVWFSFNDRNYYPLLTQLGRSYKYTVLKRFELDKAGSKFDWSGKWGMYQRYTCMIEHLR